MTHTLAMEWAQYGIRVNSISPGYVKTALTYYVETSSDWDTKMKYYVSTGASCSVSFPGTVPKANLSLGWYA